MFAGVPAFDGHASLERIVDGVAAGVVAAVAADRGDAVLHKVLDGDTRDVGSRDVDALELRVQVNDLHDAVLVHLDRGEAEDRQIVRAGVDGGRGLVRHGVEVAAADEELLQQAGCDGLCSDLSYHCIAQAGLMAVETFEEWEAEGFVPGEVTTEAVVLAQFEMLDAGWQMW